MLSTSRDGLACVKKTYTQQKSRVSQLTKPAEYKAFLTSDFAYWCFVAEPILASQSEHFEGDSDQIVCLNLTDAVVCVLGAR